MMDFFTGMFWGFIAGMFVTSIAATFVVWWELRKLPQYR